MEFRIVDAEGEGESSVGRKWPGNKARSQAKTPFFIVTAVKTSYLTNISCAYTTLNGGLHLQQNSDMRATSVV
jgi:hypothetical protein